MALDPGWCKLDWVVSDPSRAGLSNASNVIDVTWEGPDGDIVSLDGYLDAYFQEVYLDADAVPTFAKVVEVRLRGRARRVRRGARGRGAQVPHAPPQLRQGREADVQRVPAVGPAPRRRVRARALRRAGDDPVPGVVADRHARQRDAGGVVDPDRGGAGAGRRPRARGRAGARRRGGGRARQVAARAASDPRDPEVGRAAHDRGRGGAGAGRQPDQHVLPRPSRRDADDQGLHRQDAGRGEGAGAAH